MKTVSGRVYYCGDFVNTDLMAPGRFEPVESEEQLARIALIDYEGQTPFVNEQTGKSDYTVIVAGREFGCGSSRETAPQALSLAGAKIVLAKSFGGIFFRNCINMGILLPVQVDHGWSELVHDGHIDIDIENRTATIDADTVTFDDFGPLVGIIEAGGLIPYSQRYLEGMR